MTNIQGDEIWLFVGNGIVFQIADIDYFLFDILLFNIRYYRGCQT